MKPYTLFYLLLTIVWLSLTTVACGGSEPVTFSDIPVYTSSKLINEGDSVLADGLANSIKDSVAESFANTELKRYQVSLLNSEQDLRNFYFNSLKEAGWEKDERFENEFPSFIVHSWKRGRGSSEQALHIGIIYDQIGGNDAFIIVALSSK